MTRKQRRATFIGLGVGILGVAVFLVLFALRDTIVFFHTPKEVAEKQIPAGKRIRLGGLVAEGSLKRGEGLTVEFGITDTAKTIPVSYTGILPDLFREGQGVVAEGKLDPAGRFHRRHGARQARRELHAARGRQGPQGAGRLASDGKAKDRGAEMTAVSPTLSSRLHAREPACDKLLAGQVCEAADSPERLVAGFPRP